MENLERILENLKEGIIAHDLNRRIFYFNREAERITGHRRENVLGKDCHEVFQHPFCGDHCTFDAKTPPAMEQDEYSTRMTAKNGRIRRLDVSITRIDDRHGRFIGVLTSFRDVTDLLDLKLKTGHLEQFSNMVGRDSKMLQVYQQIRDVADYDYPVNILGETGTGKELVATAIHNESNRRHAPFVPINCGAMPEGLVESELFGHTKGAFTGAMRDKRGRFELADGGTLFLDEISDLSKPMQVKLLRFLQENRFEKVGGEKTISVDVRIISATNKDLKQAVSMNRFRKDLYYRLNVIPFHLPTLRARKNDIPLLINHFLEEAAETYDQKRLRVSRKAVSLMMDYSWPGNVRELINI
ncbi:MAG: sigma 54-interacting transcriptional regulator, partial [Deltaproteobacteria bacterium]|nr:sigma 54-interacting transcriptional regulator [Deltaproteobacteria bacterium]